MRTSKTLAGHGQTDTGVSRAYHALSLFDPSTPLGAVLDGAAAVLVATALLAIVHCVLKRRSGEEQPSAPVSGAMTGHTVEFDADMNTGKVTFRMRNAEDRPAPTQTE